MNLGLIGFGRFGQFAAQHLRLKTHLTVWDARDLRKKAAALGVRWGTLPEVAAQEFVLLAVPISDLPACLESVAGHVSPGALVMDCCSVKTRPVEWMLRTIPEDVHVLGTHPLFGPASGRAGVSGLTVVLCPGRGGREDLIRRFLEELGLAVVVTSPQEHDRAMAATQALTHFLGRALLEAGLHTQTLRTPAYDRLARMVELVRHASTPLYHDMTRLNPYAAEERRRLLEAMIRIHNELESLPGEV